VNTLNLYEYYGIERAGVLAGVEWMADLDWYGAAAPLVVADQKEDGSWEGPWGLQFIPVVGKKAGRVQRSDSIDTCFALLFLKKGTRTVRRGAVTRGGADAGDSDINFQEGSKLEGQNLEDFLDLVLSRWRRAPDEEVRKRLFDGATSAGARIVEPLLVRMDSPDEDKRAAAHALLRHATGQDFGWAPGAPAAEREEAELLWQSWWMGAKDKVVFDPETKRLSVR
jgi:hypothetical protein